MNKNNNLRVIFYTTEHGNEPVRRLLQSLEDVDKKIIGEDIKTLQFGWPIGMPLSKKVDTDLWEIRSRLHSCIFRILFSVVGNHIVLLHGFIKKSNKIPLVEIHTARKRLVKFKKFRS